MSENQVNIYVVISECGLNEHVLRYAGPEQPTEKQLQQWANEDGRYTGYSFTCLYQAEGDQIHHLGRTGPKW